MKKSRFTEAQILSILAEANDKPVVEVCREHNISTPTFYSWKSRYAGMSGEELRQKRTLEQDCERLKRLLAESMMDNAILKEAVQRLERLGKQ
jgi:putative transposase